MPLLRWRWCARRGRPRRPPTPRWPGATLLRCRTPVQSGAFPVSGAGGCGRTAMIVAPPVMATSPVHPTTDQGCCRGRGGEAEQPPRGLYQGHERGHADEDPAQEYRAPRGRVLVLFRDAFEELQQGQPAEESGQRPEEDADDGRRSGLRRCLRKSRGLTRPTRAPTVNNPMPTQVRKRRRVWERCSGTGGMVVVRLLGGYSVVRRRGLPGVCLHRRRTDEFPPMEPNTDGGVLVASWVVPPRR